MAIPGVKTSEEAFVKSALEAQRAFQIKMAVIDIAIQKYLPNALALVTRRKKALLLSEPNRWVRRSDTEDPRMVHRSPTASYEQLVLPF